MALNQDRKNLLDRLVAEDTPLSVLHRKHGFNELTVRKYYPEYRKGVSNRDIATSTITEEQRTLVNELVAEEAPLNAIREITGLTRTQVLAVNPSAAWDRSKVGEFGAMIAGARKKGVRV